MGRRLTALENDDTSITYVYDASGQRVSKTVNGVTTEFYYDDRGSLILSSRSDGTDIYFYPDADGSIGSFNYSTYRYYYVRNAQNDVIGITDKTGAFVARYTYDEWGNITSITDGNGNDVSANPNHIANLNPLRYRSYFYDTETGWYWLNTRYYNPVVGRFINADGYASTGQGILGHNMFAYCLNNPIIFEDSNGEFVITIFGVTIGAKAFMILTGVTFTATAVTMYASTPSGQRATRGLVSAVQNVVDSLYDAITVKEEVASLRTTDDVASDIIELEKAKKKRQPTVIYRYHATKDTNLAPRKNIDFDDLSFSLIPPQEKQLPAVTTTIEELTATGVFTTIIKGNHVAVIPKNGSVKYWMYLGMDSPWSKILSTMVQEIGG